MEQEQRKTLKVKELLLESVFHVSLLTSQAWDLHEKLYHNFNISFTSKPIYRKTKSEHVIKKRYKLKFLCASIYVKSNRSEYENTQILFYIRKSASKYFGQ